MARDGAIVPLFGTGIKGFSQIVTSQRRVNVYVEMATDPEKGPIAVFGRPGLTLRVDLSGIAGFFTRGMMESFKYTTPFDGDREIGLAVVSSGVYTLSQTTTGTIGSLGTSLGGVGFAKNPTQVMIADGQYGYFIDVSAGIGPLTKITATWFPNGATSVCFLNGRGFAVRPNSGEIRYSALNDFNAGDASNFYTAESDPDDLRVVTVHYNQLALLGQYTSEFWASGSGTTVIQRVGGAALQWGVAAPRSVKQVDQGTVFVGQNRLGDKKVLLMQGYSANPISTPALEYDLQDANIDAATAAAYTINGHSFYRLNLPDRVWLYDLTSRTWNEETTGPGTDRGIAELGALIDGRYMMSDYRSNGRIYYIDPNVYTDNSDVIKRLSVTRHVFADYDRTTLDKVGLDFETGVGLVQGQGNDPQVFLRVSRDQGRTWGTELWRPLGKIGEYLHRVWFGPYGRARNWTFEVSMADPVKFALTGGALKVRP